MRALTLRLPALLISSVLFLALWHPAPAAANGVGTVYVVSEAESSISVLDTTTNTVVEVISVDLPPRSIAFSPDAHFVFVSHIDSNVISVIDTSVEDVVATVKSGSQVGWVTVTAAGAWLLASDPVEGKLRVFDSSSRQELYAIQVGGAPEMVAATPDGNMAFTADRASGMISIVDLRGRLVVRTVQAGAGAHQVAVSPTGMELLVSGINSTGLLLIDATTGSVSRTLNTGWPSGAMAFSPTGDIAYVARADLGEIGVVPVAGGGAGTIPLSGSAAGLGVSRDGKRGYATLKDTGRVAVVDLARKAAIVEVVVEKGPAALVVSPLQPRETGVVIPGALPNTGDGPGYTMWGLVGLLLVASGLALRSLAARPRE